MSGSRLAVVTGAASGIGAATARRLARDGRHVVVVDVAQDAGAEVAAAVGGEYIALDVGDAAAWNRFAAALADRPEPLDRVVLNAGILSASTPTPFLELPAARVHQVRAVNLDGVLFGVHALAPRLIAAGGGSIVVTASIAGLGPYAEDPVYAATKHALVGFVRSVAPQLDDAGVRIHAVCPGGVETAIFGPDQAARVEAMRAAGRPVLAPAAVADAIAELLERPEAGLVHTVVHGRGSAPYEFRGVPGPRP